MLLLGPYMPQMRKLWLACRVPVGFALSKFLTFVNKIGILRWLAKTIYCLMVIYQQSGWLLTIMDAGKVVLYIWAPQSDLGFRL